MYIYICIYYVSIHKPLEAYKLARHPNSRGSRLPSCCAGRTMAEDDYEQFYKADHGETNGEKRTVILGVKMWQIAYTFNKQEPSGFWAVWPVHPTYDSCFVY